MMIVASPLARAQNGAFVALIAAVAVYAAVFFGLSAALAPQSAAAKSYTIDKVAVTATVQTDGSMRVVERRSMTFDGDFSRVYWYLDLAGAASIDVLGVSGPDGPFKLTDKPAARPPGTFCVTAQGDRLLVEAFDEYSGATTLKLEYAVAGAAKRWKDTAELYWQFVGAGWDEPTKRVVLDLAPPADRGSRRCSTRSRDGPTRPIRRERAGRPGRP